MATEPGNEDVGPELAGLREALARVLWIREELDPLTRAQALEDLEDDLTAVIDRLEGRAA